MPIGRRRRFVGLLAGVLVLALLGSGAAGAAARERLPVPWTAGAGTDAQSRHPNSPPPGSNDFSCKPTRGHRNPVVLVHGLGANRTVNWSTISPLLANHGYCVFALTYGTKPDVSSPQYQPGGLVRMQESARELKAFVNRVRRRTGARKVDIVGHSEGSLMPNYYVKFLGGDRHVDDYVGVTPLWDGTNLAGLATADQIARAFGFSATLSPYCDSCHQFLNGSEFLRKMNSGGGAAVPSVDYTMIMTRYDELVIPYTSGILDGRGVTNIVVQDQCPRDRSEHLSIIYGPTAAADVLNALDPRHAQPPPCVHVLPFIGAPTFSGDVRESDRGSPRGRDRDGAPRFRRGSFSPER